MKIRKVVIPAAGLGTRFLPATKAQPKEMLPIVDKPTIQYIIEEAVNAGAESILIITGRNKRAIEDHFDRAVELETELEQGKKWDLLEEVQAISNLAKIHYIRQKQPLGLGHAILCAEDFIGDEPFGVLLGDDIVDAKTPALKQLFCQYETVGKSIVGVQSVRKQDVSKYGIISPKESNGALHLLQDMVEKPAVEEAPSNLAILGRYVLNPSIFEELKQTPKGKGGEIQLTDGIKRLMAKEEVYAYEFTGKRYDVGDRVGFLSANVEFALKREDIGDDFKAYLKQLVQEL